MSTTVIHLDDELLDVVEGLKGSGSHDAAEAILGRYLAPALPHVHAVRLLQQLADTNSAHLARQRPEDHPWLNPTPEQREGFAYISGDNTLPLEIRNLARVALKFCRKRYWDDDHEAGLRRCVWEAKSALRKLQDERTE